MNALKVGDVCIGQNHVYCTDLNGMECIIERAAELRTARHPLGHSQQVYAYMVLWANGRRTATEASHLRKRRPPSTDESESRQAMLDCIERAKQPIGVPA